jgi:hypothetical protein
MFSREGFEKHKEIQEKCKECGHSKASHTRITGDEGRKQRLVSGSCEECRNENKSDGCKSFT